MGGYSRYPLGATVVAVTTLIFSMYSIVLVSYLIATFGPSFRDECHNQDNISFLENVFRSMKKVMKEDERMQEPSWMRWFEVVQTTPDNCDKVLQPLLGALIAWDVIISILFVATLLMFLGLTQRKPVFIIPFMIWLAIIIIFVFAAVIAIATRLHAPQAALVIACSILFLIIPSYYWLVTVRHHRQVYKS